MARRSTSGVKMTPDQEAKRLLESLMQQMAQLKSAVKAQQIARLIIVACRLGDEENVLVCCMDGVRSTSRGSYQAGARGSHIDSSEPLLSSARRKSSRSVLPLRPPKVKTYGPTAATACRHLLSGKSWLGILYQFGKPFEQALFPLLTTQA